MSGTVTDQILFLYIRKFHFLTDRKMMKENKKS